MHVRFIITGLLIAAFSVLSYAAADTTFAERLGWNKGDRVIILNADDAGMSYASNMGTIDGLEAGVISSITVMMPCPWVPGIAAYLKDNPEVCAGVHISMCSEWDYYRFMPVAGKAAVPSLTDEMGCLWDNNGLLNQHAKPDEIETEIRAQIDRAETMGINITHMDSHMWSLFSNPKFTERYVKVGLDKNIPLRFVGGVEGGYAGKDMIEACKPFVKEVWEGGLPVLDDLHTQSYDWDTTDKTDHYSNDIRNVKPGITEFVVHPTKPGEEIGVITNNRTKLYGDYVALTNPEILRVIKEEGIILTSWRELKERRARLGASTLDD